MTSSHSLLSWFAKKMWISCFSPPPWVSHQVPYQDTKLGQAGVVSWRDSALLRAAKAGRCVVVDEADKAPLEAMALSGNWRFPKWYSMT